MSDLDTWNMQKEKVFVDQEVLGAIIKAHRPLLLITSRMDIRQA